MKTMKILLSLVILLQIGCSTTDQPAKTSLPESEPEPIAFEQVNEAAVYSEPGSFPPALLFRLMAAEIAAQNGDVVFAASEYIAAAFETKDIKLIEQAIRYAAMGGVEDFDEVAELAQVWVDLAPDVISAHQALAMIQLQRGDRETAVSQLDHLLENFESFDLNMLVELLVRQSDRISALVVMEQLAAMRADNADAHFAHAHLAIRLGDTEQALMASQRVLELRPNGRDGVNLRSRILQMVEREGDAIILLSEKLAGELKDDVELRQSLARLLLRDQKIEAAWEEYQLLVQQQPDDESNLYMFAMTSLELEKLALGRETLMKLVDGEQHRDDAYFHLGRISEVEKQPEQALDWYRQVERGQYLIPARLQQAGILAKQRQYDDALEIVDVLESEDPELQLNIAMVKGDILMGANHFEQAYQLYDEMLQQQPKSILLLYSRSMASEKLGKYAESEADLYTILEIDENNADAMNALGYTLANRNQDLPRALSYLQRAMELKPDSGAITDSLGWLYYRMGDLEQAHKYLRQALELMYDAEIAAHLGEVLWVKGEHERARHVWQKALERDPEHPVLRETMERLDP